MSEPSVSSSEITALWNMVLELQHNLTDGMASLQAALDAETAARIAEDHLEDMEDAKWVFGGWGWDKGRKLGGQSHFQEHGHGILTALSET
jgi:hypothetical protein